MSDSKDSVLVAVNTETSIDDDAKNAETNANIKSESKTECEKIRNANSPVLNIDTEDNLELEIDKTKQKKSAENIDFGDMKIVDVDKIDCDKESEGKRVENSKVNTDSTNAETTAAIVETDASEKQQMKTTKDSAVSSSKSTSNNVAVEQAKTESKSKEKNNNKESLKSVWISNISRGSKACDLKEHLSKHGKVLTAKIVTDGNLYFGYAVMDKAEEALKCVEVLNGTYFETKKISVSLKTPESVETKDRSTHKSTNSETASNGGRSSTRSRHDKRKSTPTLKNKSPNSRRTRSDMVREMENMKRKMMEDERRREDRHREERQREKERDERRRVEMEQKLRDARKKLEVERQAFEKEKIALIKLQKIAADQERDKLKREKDNLKKEYKEIEAGLKRRRMDEQEYDRRNKKREELPARKNWRNENEKRPPLSGRTDANNFNFKPTLYSPIKKTGSKFDESKLYCVAPPPPKLSNDYDFQRQKSEENYRKVNYIDGPRRLDERKQHLYDSTRDTNKKFYEKNRYQNEYSRPKYPSAIAGFPNGKPDFMDGKVENEERRRNNYLSSDYSPVKSNWKNLATPYEDWKSNVAPRHQQYSSSSTSGNYSGTNYYQQENRYEFHGRKY